MPYAPLQPCTMPGCGVLVPKGRCEKHRRVEAKIYDKQRGSAAKRGYDSKWATYRRIYLQQHPLCACPDCQSGAKRITPAEVVDHKIPFRVNGTINYKLLWDPANHQPMAKRCHDRKTAKHDSWNRKPGGEG